MEGYKSKVRTTLHDMDNLPNAGVYVIAYMGKVLYVGKASESVFGRIKGHLYRRSIEDLGTWMYRVRDDWHNVRLDVLEPPDETIDVGYWLRSAESSLIRCFHPLFNEQINH